MNAIELLVLLSNELEDAVDFMELFENDELGEENRLESKIEALEKVNAFLNENQK